MKTALTIFLLFCIFPTGGTASEIEHPRGTATGTLKEIFTRLADRTSP